jgi:phage gp29-like protein
VEASGKLSGITNPYQVMALFCNREMSKAVLGQTLTTDTEGSTGTFAAGKVHEGVRMDLLEADAITLAKTVRLQILRPLVGFNFGWEKPVPGFAFNIAEDEDLKAVAETYKILAEMGYPITVAHISERFGVPMAQKDELLVNPPPQPQPPGPSGTDDAKPGGRPADEEGEKGKRGKGEKGKSPEPAALKEQLPKPFEYDEKTFPLLCLLLKNGRQADLSLIPQDWQVIQTQQELEALSQAAIAASADAAAAMLKPVWDLIQTGESLEAIRDGLIDAYGAMPVDEMAELLYQARMLAYMKGRGESS